MLSGPDAHLRPNGDADDEPAGDLRRTCRRSGTDALRGTGCWRNATLASERHAGGHSAALKYRGNGRRSATSGTSRCKGPAGVGQRRLPGASGVPRTGGPAPARCSGAAGRGSSGVHGAVGCVCIGEPVVMAPGVYIPHGQVVVDGLTEVGSDVILFPGPPSGCVRATSRARRSGTGCGSVPGAGTGPRTGGCRRVCGRECSRGLGRAGRCYCRGGARPQGDVVGGIVLLEKLRKRRSEPTPRIWKRPPLPPATPSGRPASHPAARPGRHRPLRCTTRRWVSRHPRGGPDAGVDGVRNRRNGALIVRGLLPTADAAELRSDIDRVFDLWDAELSAGRPTDGRGQAAWLRKLADPRRRRRSASSGAR